jgi:hypothetical protein
MRRNANWLELITAALCLLGIIGCVIAATSDRTAFLHAWLCSYLFWLGLPLAGITLVLVHDLSGGGWMATARPVVDAAAATMPIASLAGIPAFVGLNSLYSWTHPPPELGNVFYLNPTDFFRPIWGLRCAVEFVGRVCVVGTAARRPADTVGAVLDKRRWADRAGLFDEFCSH